MNRGAARASLDAYLEKALIPTLNKKGVKRVGVFTEMGNPEPVIVYLLIAYPSAITAMNMRAVLEADPEFTALASAYNSLSPDKEVYSRYEASLLRAFDTIRKHELPKHIEGKAGRVFELRTYEGYSEDAVRRKILMFNKEELPLFYKVGLHPIFFGEGMAGKDLPSLTYMLGFSDMAEREANWKTFIDHPEWKRMSVLPEYENSVSRIVRKFLLPTGYSQM